MRNSEISGILCSTEINLNGIPTVVNLTEINWTSQNPEIPRKSLTKVMKLFRYYKISGITGNIGNNQKFWTFPKIPVNFAIN